MRKMLKRTSVLSLIFLLAFSTFAYAAPGNIVVDRTNLKKETLSEDNITAYDVDEVVRVTVEIDGEAPIEKATKKGVKFGDLSVSEKKKLLNEAKSKKQAAKKAMKDKKIDAEYLQDFDAVMNGFSAEVKYGDIEKIKKLPNVKNVVISTLYEKPIVEPDMEYSKDLVEAQFAWNEYGYKGEGMVVGVIDSGVDHGHQDFLISEETEVALTEDDVTSVITSEGLPGKYYTEKVPYGYNYFDQNHDYTDFNGSSGAHGMHVAGTVGANGDVENGGITGIAPEAQILNLKVFSNDPAFGGTYSDIYVAAIDDAIKLGADVLNMSLGSPAGFVNHESPDQVAVSRAVENGIMMAISAGNSAMYGDGFFYPYASNPDYGVVGSPGISYDSLQVASFENSHTSVDELQYSIDGADGENAGFMSAGAVAPTIGTTFELVEAGLGHPEDYEGKEVEGKFALVQRGELDFVTKALNAQAAGASGVIVYNNTDGMISMASDPAIVIPQLFLGKTDGDALAQALLDGQAASVTFTGGKTAVPNAEAGKMSAFSSWGLTQNLDFKPEITAPGGQIYSTLNNGGYGSKNGTSMAAPHVAGGSALVMERVDSDFGLEGRDRVEFAKKLLMNTSALVEFDGALVSPRRQGAGLMQLHAALSTPVIVTDSETGEAKVALKEVNENQVTFELTAENFTDEAVSYEVSANAQTDTPVNAGVTVTAPNLYGALDLGDVTTVNGEAVSTVEVPANGTASFEVTIDVSDWDADLKSIYTNGYWLEGFVTLTDPTDINPELSVPYVGFKGEWDDAPIFDTALWSGTSFYEVTGVVTSLGEGNFDYIGQDDSNLAFSPNGDGVLDDAGLLLSFLRNVKEVSFNVLDAKGNVVETIATEEYLRKDYYDSGRASHYKVSSDWMWDGTINGKKARDGHYYLQAEGVIDFEGAEAQSIEIPVLLDTTKPSIRSVIQRGKREALIMVRDGQGSGISELIIEVNGEEVDVPEGETEYLLKNVHPSSVVEVTTIDNAGNVSYSVVMGPQGNGHGKFDRIR
ncbi:S8 family serine peptidase [Paucisalibacillus globulus]|uniref:S8 family serine peptidase n=1 Tax=Paucisalibacillus globulus TaxID=351095 RepID=UPI00042428BF|nr:S8 family serine peptidase [Paucisalibacillus globulus]